MTATTATVPPAPTLASTAAAEWWKLRSLHSTRWFLGGAALLMLLMAVLESNDGDPTTIQAVPVAMGAVNYFVQYILAAFAMLAITSEFATRSITVTLACTPSRTRVMLAKTAVAGSVVLVTGLFVTGLGVVAGAARFDELDDLGAEQVVTVLKIGTYLTLLAILALGIGTLVRRTAGGLAVLLVLLLILPEVLSLVAERFGLDALGTAIDFTPTLAGSRFIGGEWEFGLVLLGWAAAGVLAGIWALRSRDA
jgi:ABC-type transport system involved in multi-copper enzyme maturation permease subunit